MATISTAIGTGLTQVSSDAMGVIGTIVPIALGIAGAVFVVRKAIGWFKSMAK